MSRTTAGPHSGHDDQSGSGTAESGDTPLLEVRGLRKYFDQSDGFIDRLVGDTRRVRAVDGVDLTLREGETLGIVGESGCGKSTLGETMLNLQTATEGTVRFRGEELTGLSKRQMRPFRRNVQMVFQDPLSSLNPRHTIADVLTAPMEVHGIGESASERRELAADHLERVGLNASHLERYPHQFSGGQQQRIAIARALTVDPDLLVADEPVSALDVSVQAQILDLLKRLQEDLDLALVFIAHDLSVVRYVADRVAVMYLGEIVERAPVDDLFEDPHHPYTKSLLSAVPQIDPQARADRILLEGTVPSPLDPPSGCRFHTRCPVIVPPDDWTGTPDAFKDAFTFRARLEAGQIDPDAVRATLSTAGDSPAADAVADRIIEHSLPRPLASLPDDAATAIRSAATALVDGAPDDAATILADALSTPCERDHPATVSADGDHQVACHRVDPDDDADASR